jgi:hypothetical protein
MKDCLLYKYIVRNFRKQILFTLLLLSSAVIVALMTVPETGYTIKNIGYAIFPLSVISFALMILISSFKGRRDNISKLSALIGTKEFDEVIIESTKEELNVVGNKVKERIPQLLFVKAKGKIVFQMMFSQKDFNGINEYLKELKNGQENMPAAVKNVNYDGTGFPGTFVSDVA